MLKSLTKALQIIEILSGDKKAYGITEISKALDLYKSNVHEILATLEAFGYVKKDPISHQYSLALKFLQIAHFIGERFEFQQLLHAKLQDLCNEVGEVVYFGILDGEQVMYLDGTFPHLNAHSEMPVIGMTVPLHSTGIGKVLLANVSEAQLEKLLQKPRFKYTENTIVEESYLRQELSAIRQRGFSIDNMEQELGVKSIAVPVFNGEQRLLGALGLTGPSLRFSRHIYNRYAKLLMQKAVEIGQIVDL